MIPAEPIETMMDLKRYLRQGKKLKLVRHDAEPDNPFIHVIQVVTWNEHKGIYTRIPGLKDSPKYWLSWPLRKNVNFRPNGFDISTSKKPFEQIARYEYV